MQVSVESPSKLERRVTVIVPPERFNKAYDNRIAKLAEKAKIDGYRQGKAPLHVVKQRYGDTIHQEALSEVIQASLYDALNLQKLRPASTPTVEPKVIEMNQPLEFTATFEIFPELDSFKFKLETVEKQIAVIADADIEKVIGHLRTQHTHWKKVDRAAKMEDKAVIDFRGSINGAVFSGGEAHDYPIVLGSKTMIPGFEEGVVGMKTGEEKTISVTFAENYFAKEVAGKAAEFAIKVISIFEPELPETDGTFVKKLGIKSGELADLKTEIRKNLERELDRVISEKLKKQIFDKLLEQNTIEIPKTLIEREAARIHDRVHPHHGEHHSHTEAEMASFNDAAKRNVALGLLIGEIAKQHNIVVNKERVQTQLAKIASAYQNPAEVIDWYVKNPESYAEVKMQILEDQIIEKLLEQVKITEKMLSYNDLISSQ